jgi:hypothetical protein
MERHQKRKIIFAETRLYYTRTCFSKIKAYETRNSIYSWNRVYIKHLVSTYYNNTINILFIKFTQGTGKSHSVTVNLQKAFALLKNHSHNSCSVCNKKNTKNATNKNKSKKRSVFIFQFFIY